MADRFLDIKRVAVIGAGVSGIAAGIHLKKAGLDVRIFERSSRAGGVWVYDERIAKDAAYPSALPSVGDSPEYDDKDFCGHERQDSPLNAMYPDSDNEEIVKLSGDISLSFAPPGPAYLSLKNNVSTVEMEMTCQSWKPGTEEFVPHSVLAEYIHDAGVRNEVVGLTSFNSRVDSLCKIGELWRLELSHLDKRQNGSRIKHSTEKFDGVVVATGNYHACNIPDIPGLSKWKEAYPNDVRHSKTYRQPSEYAGKNVLLIGAGVSSMDIARDLGDVARAVYQSSRGGHYDIPSHLLPVNAARISGIESFGELNPPPEPRDGTIPGVIVLASGELLCGIHKIIVCTGYHVSFPFMRQFHSDGVQPEDASETTLVTNGQQTHNLHKDIWYIPDPTLTFVGVPYHTATFSLFEQQAIALAAVFSGRAPLPRETTMREEYKARMREKGPGRAFHSLRGPGQEIAYVKELVEMVNSRKTAECPVVMEGHSRKWLDAYARRRQRQQALFARSRDAALDKYVLSLLPGC